MLHLARVFLALVKMNFSYNSHYRANSLIHFMVSVFMVTFYFLTVNVIFMYTDNLLGWTKNEVLVLVGLFRIVKSIVDVFVRVNFTRFFETVRFGQFDFYLSKPINPLLLSSFKIIIFPEISDLFVGVFFIVYAVGLNHFFNPIFLMNMLFGIVFGSIAYYTILFALIPLAFYFHRLTAIGEIANVFSQVIRYPMNVYTRGVIFFDLMTLPLAVVVYFPAMIVLEKISDFRFYLIEMVIVILMFLVVFYWWNLSLKRYSSASS